MNWNYVGDGPISYSRLQEILKENKVNEQNKIILEIHGALFYLSSITYQDNNLILHVNKFEKEFHNKLTEYY